MPALATLVRRSMPVSGDDPRAICLRRERNKRGSFVAVQVAARAEDSWPILLRGIRRSDASDEDWAYRVSKPGQQIRRLPPWSSRTPSNMALPSPF
jgi:hypothetical protein